MIAGAALLVLAAWSPFALLRLIPMMEIAAASVTNQRASMSRAAGSAGIQTPAAYMRQAMDRNSRPSTSPANATAWPRTMYWQSRSTEQSGARTANAPQGESAMRGTQGGGSQARPSSNSSGGTVYPTGQQRGATTSPGSQRGSATQTDSPPASGTRLRVLRRTAPDAPRSRRLRVTEGANERGQAALTPASAPLERRGSSAAPLRVPPGAGDRGGSHRRGDPDAHDERRHRDRIRARTRAQRSGVLLLAYRWPFRRERLPIAGRHAARRVRRAARLRLDCLPQAGVQPWTGGRPEPIAKLPDAGRDLELLAAPLQGEQVGVIKDSRARTYTAALAVKVTSFGLLDRGEQESRQAGWGGVLAGLAREGSPVSRIQWIERTSARRRGRDRSVPRRGLDEDAAAPVDSAPIKAVPRADERRAGCHGRITTSSSCLQIDAKRLAWRQMKRARREASGPDAGAMRCPAARTRGARRPPLPPADVQVDRGAWYCRPGTLAAATPRGPLDPVVAARRLAPVSSTSADPDRDGVTEEMQGLASVCIGDVLEPHTGPAARSTPPTGSLGWPRIDVGAAFLSPLLLHAQMVRAVAS